MIRRILSGVLLACHTTAILMTECLEGCTSWQVQKAPVKQVVEMRRPASILVTLADRSHIILYQPRIAGNTVIAFARSHRSSDPAPEITISTAQVRQVAVREWNALRTAVLIIAVIVLAVVILFALAFGEALAQWYEED